MPSRVAFGMQPTERIVRTGLVKPCDLISTIRTCGKDAESQILAALAESPNDLDGC
jgi:hypothetical protein